ncbi:hypothetical protein EYF80_023781 [Liparis tanakae]|uniref:Uncharacterized protein n=1 Tax=Liparis tanakae TaxID=230148 RepID=A0A4Z2HL50_9TELE|nr:hypothetical protein EYF80_023781 [Liparis tanakae]
MSASLDRSWPIICHQSSDSMEYNWPWSGRQEHQIKQILGNNNRRHRRLTISLLKNSCCTAVCLWFRSKQLTLRGLFRTSRTKLPARKHSRANDT